MPDPFGGPTPQELLQQLRALANQLISGPASQHPGGSAFNAPIAPENRALMQQVLQRFMQDIQSQFQSFGANLRNPETFQGPLGPKVDASIIPPPRPEGPAGPSPAPAPRTPQRMPKRHIPMPSAQRTPTDVDRQMLRALTAMPPTQRPSAPRPRTQPSRSGYQRL